MGRVTQWNENPQTQDGGPGCRAARVRSLGGGRGPRSLHGPQDGAGTPEQERLRHGPRGAAAPLELTQERVGTSGNTSAPERPRSTKPACNRDTACVTAHGRAGRGRGCPPCWAGLTGSCAGHLTLIYCLLSPHIRSQQEQHRLSSGSRFYSPGQAARTRMSRPARPPGLLPCPPLSPQLPSLFLPPVLASLRPGCQGDTLTLEHSRGSPVQGVAQTFPES